MKPFKETGQFKQNEPNPTTAPSFVPSWVGHGVEIRRGRDLGKRENSLFISSGRWAEMPDDGLIDQQISPAVIGELIDPLDISAYTDQDERKTAEQVLSSAEIISGETIDFFPGTEKDGRSTIFNLSARSYVVREEIPYTVKGIKVFNETILGYSVGTAFNPFFDGGQSDLGLTRDGFYGHPSHVTLSFVDKTLTDGLGFEIDIDNFDFNAEYQTGAFGTPIYSTDVAPLSPRDSPSFRTDSIAYAGLKK